MKTPGIRKILTRREEIRSECSKPIDPPIHRVVAAAIVSNPYAGVYVEDLSELTDVGERLGQELGTVALESLRVGSGNVHSFGKAALVGQDGELEHAAALLHPKFGAGFREAIGGGRALIPSAKSVGGLGQLLSIPLGHSEDAYVRSHFDTVAISVNDAPRRSEILVALAVTDGGRPLARVGGRTVEDVQSDN